MAVDDVVVRATNLGKSYTRYRSRWAMLMDRIQGTTKRGEPHWAIRGVSLEVRRGESFGVMGRNGAGKSTLLQILAGVVQPTVGTIEVRGRVLALLELGAGFDPEATGRENARMLMALLGVAQRDIAPKLLEVQSFAEIGDAIDQPVKTYSSGMFVRLAFAINTSLEPDVLLVDEALAVGDIFFQQRCHARLEELQARGVSILLVSHSVPDIQLHTSRAMVLDRGRIAFQGPSVEAGAAYLALGETSMRVGPRSASPAGGTGGVSLSSIHVESATGGDIVVGESVRVVYEATFEETILAPVYGIEVHDVRGRRMHGRHSLHEPSMPPMAPAGGRVRVIATFEARLPPGEYTIRVFVAAFPPELAKDRSTLDPSQAWALLGIKAVGMDPVPMRIRFPDRRNPFREIAGGPAILEGSLAVERLPN